MALLTTSGAYWKQWPYISIRIYLSFSCEAEAGIEPACEALQAPS